MTEQIDKFKNWAGQLNKSYKIAIAVIVVLSMGATVYWAFVNDSWGTQMFADVYDRYKCVFKSFTSSISTCVAETVPLEATV